MPKFIDELKFYDPEFYEPVSAIAGLAMKPGALDEKTKLLIAIALDALGGHKKGVEKLAKAAKKAGITKNEVAEALRLAYFVAGNGVLALADEAFEEFEDDDDDDDDDDRDKEKEDVDEDANDEYENKKEIDDNAEDEDEDEDEDDDEEQKYKNYDERNSELNAQDDLNSYTVSTLAVYDEKPVYGPSYLVRMG